MINELFIYDREQGLFQKILEKSTIMAGRYHVSPNSGNDLNTNNLETYIKDPANGLIDVPKKYPLCVCLTPKSRFVKVNGMKLEEFTFHLFFLCTTFYTGDNKVKSPDQDTNTSAHHIWYDWADMKACAKNFLEMLELQLKRDITEGDKTYRLKNLVNMEGGNAIMNRFSKFNVDRLSGVSITFQMYLQDVCELSDYQTVGMNEIVLPPLDIHPLHKQ